MINSRHEASPAPQRRPAVLASRPGADSQYVSSRARQPGAAAGGQPDHPVGQRGSAVTACMFVLAPLGDVIERIRSPSSIVSRSRQFDGLCGSRIDIDVHIVETSWPEALAGSMWSLRS